jgi:uncharacterized protein
MRQFPVLLVTGARQVGKTTFLKHLSAGKRTYVTMDDPRALDLARNDPPLFLQRYPPPLLIDEIQYAPELFPYLKMIVDKNRAPNQFWLTGSQQFHLMRGISESLAGRVALLQLLGLSRREMLSRSSKPFVLQPKQLARQAANSDKITLKQLYHLIWRGSFPAIALNKRMNKDLFYSSYVQTYLQRDIHDLSRVGDQLSFLQFLRAACARTGQLLNLAELARDAGVAPNTAKTWLSILQSSGIAYLLEPFYANVTKRLVKTPKLYILDTGLCSYLTEWSSPETLEVGAMSGAILETWIIVELLKSYWHSGRRAPFYYYRDKDQKEIDLLIVEDGVICPFEIKKTASPGKDDLRHFQVLERLNMPIGAGGVICLSDDALPLTQNAWSIPAAII